MQVTGPGRGQARGPAGGRDVHPLGQRGERRDAPPSSATISPSSSMSANSAASPASSGKATVTSRLVARAQAQPAVAHVGEHPHAVPLDLVQPVRRRPEWPAGCALASAEHGAHGSILPQDSTLDDGAGGIRPMRAIWKGAVSFGLVNVPVRLYTRDREPRHAVPPGAPRGRRPDQVPAGLQRSTARRSPTTTSPRATRPRTARWSSSPTRTSPSCR